jgi:hypothetical protein
MFFSSVSAVACACLMSAAAAANPCTNGSFEDLNPQGFPTDWMPVGSLAEVSTDAHSGTHSVRMVRTADTQSTETGLNRAYGPNTKKGGAMLDQRSGGIDFWYKAASAQSAELCVYAIAMDADAVEKTGAARAKFAVPSHHIGDGQWHHARLKYDFSGNPKARWVQFAARIVGTAGELLLDDVSHVERVGMLLRVSDIRLEEDNDRPGELCVVRAKIENAGDAEVTGLRATIQLPEGLAATPAEVQIDALAPDRATRAVWKVQGSRRAAGRFEVTARAGDVEEQAHLDLRSGLVIRSFGPAAPVVAVGESAAVECVLENTGHVILTNPACEFAFGSETSRQTLPAIPPGRTAVLRAQFSPKEQAPQVRTAVNAGADGIAEALKAESVVTVGAAVALPAEVGRLGAKVEKDFALLENNLVRLAFRRSAYGFGAGELSVVSGGGWKTVAWLPQLSRLVVQDKAGTRVEKLIYAKDDPEVTEAGPARLRFRWDDQDSDGRRWTLSASFELADWAKEFTVRYELSCDQPAQLLAFDGPMLYSLQRDEAVFPGLEWLLGDEVSSSSLDIAEDHPDRVRYVVHPNMVTIPAVGLSGPSATVGLVWDVHQRWDGSRDRPSAVFASPDRFQNQRSHLVGLFLPTVPEFVDRNQREAARPYALKAGQKLRLEAKLIADAAAKSPLAVVERWIALYGLPEPAPLPRGSYQREIEFSMLAYLQSLWMPDSKQWWTTKGNAVMSTTGRPRSYIADLMLGALMIRDEDLRRRCRTRAEEVRALVGGEPRLDAQRFPNRADLAFADPGAAAQLLAQRGPDGAWRFDADQQHDSGPFVGMDYYALGPDDAVELGTCARQAYEVLRYARIAGDQEAYQRMQDTLTLMKRFRVPRAAQVWEIPVHTPDLLAAADAVDAFVEAYRVSGDRRWLDDATLWAKRGLPFIYLWNDAEKPYLVGASIPVFGATWYRGSWFGRPVQWNGLRYASALLRLSEHDDSFPWRKLAETVIRSAIHQQEPQGENVALWPDAISAIDGERSDWIFGPHEILMAVWKLLGRAQEPSTTIVGPRGRQVHVSTFGKVVGAAHQGTVISVDVSYPEGEQGVLLVANVTRPDAVFLDGRSLKERIDIEQGDESSWRYDAGNAYLAIRVARSGSSKVRADGVVYRAVKRLPYLAERIAFEFDDSLDGWLPAHDISELVPQNGALFGRISGGDPYLLRPLLRVDGDRCQSLRLGLRVTAGSGGQLYWSTESSPGFDERKTVRFQVIPDGRFHEYRIDLGQEPAWKGQTITALRLDPCNGARAGEFNVDYLRADYVSAAPK